MLETSELLFSNGGPFALIPEKFLSNWGGVDSNSFFSSDETDYEVLCDKVLSDTNFEPQELIKFDNMRYFSIFEESMCLEVWRTSEAQFIVPGFTLYNERTLLSCILDKTVPLGKPSKRVNFSLNHGPLILFEGAYPGVELKEHSVLAEKNEHIMYEYVVRADDFMFRVYKLVLAALD